MKRTLTLAAFGCFGMLAVEADLRAQPALVPPGVPATRPAEAAPADTVYVIRRDATPSEVWTSDDGLETRPITETPPSQEMIEGRHRALEQHRLGDNAYRAGHTQEALAHYAPLTSNAYLTLQERQQIARLCEQLQQKDARRASARQGAHALHPVASRPDPDRLLAEARQALAMRNYERAETLAIQAREAGHTTFFPWSDTPAKVLSEVRWQLGMSAAKKPGGMQIVQAPRAQEPVRQGTPSNRFSEPGRFSEPSARTAESSTPSTVRRDADPAVERSVAARGLLQEAHRQIEAGDLARAKQLLAEAEAMKVGIPWWEEFTPEKIRLALVRAEQAKTRPGQASGLARAQPARERPAAPPAPSTHSTSPLSAKAEIATTPENYTSPLSAAAEVPMSTPAPGADPRAIIAEARRQLQAGQHDRAVELAKQAQLAGGVRWGHFEDSPDRILTDVAKARQELNDHRVVALLADARQLLNEGRLDEAEKLTYQAEALRHEYPVLWRGERHDRLRQEITEKRRASAKTHLPPLDPVKQAPAGATKPMPPPGKLVAETPWRLLEPRKPESEIIASAPPLARSLPRLPEAPADRAANAPGSPTSSSPAEVIARSEGPRDQPARPVVQQRPSDAPRSAPTASTEKRAGQLVAQVRSEQREGLLLDALASWQLAKQQHAGGPQDDVTDETLARLHAELQRDAQSQMAAFAAAVQALTNTGHFSEAERYLRHMQSLAAAFDIDPAKSLEHMAKSPGYDAAVRPASGSDHSPTGAPVNVTVIVSGPGVDPVIVTPDGVKRASSGSRR